MPEIRFLSTIYLLEKADPADCMPEDLDFVRVDSKSVCLRYWRYGPNLWIINKIDMADRKSVNPVIKLISNRKCEYGFELSRFSPRFCA